MEPIGGEIRRELDRFGTPGAIGDVVRAWPAAVGEAIARNAWPARIARDGTLHVATSSSAWAFELTQLEPTVRDRLRAELGPDAPPRMRFAPGRLPDRGPGDPEEPGGGVPLVTEDERRRAAEFAQAIEDEELRTLVARAAAASLAGVRSDRAL